MAKSMASKRLFTVIIFLFAFLFALGLHTSAQARPDWRARVAENMPLLGHRNWILIVDSAYPLQTSPGIETIETNAGQLEVVRHVLHAIEDSVHVRPLIYMDAELPFVPEEDAMGVSVYRTQIHDLLANYNVELIPHEKVIADINEAGQTFHILVLKTNLTIPYTSVFMRLDCKYWSADAEQRLRSRMGSATNK
jgi:hypothetical protein